MACCGEPMICCGDGREGHRAKDGWYCGCACLNGITQISVALILGFAGLWLSVATLVDCKFAIIDNGYPYADDNIAADMTRRGVGFITFERSDGSCYFYNNAGLSLEEDVARSYVDFLGSEWQLGRWVAATTPVISLFTWLYTWSFLCTAQVSACRYTIGVLLSVVCVILQCLTFSALASSWCDENGCKFDRSSGMSIGAVFCFFLTGLCFFFSSNYPGDRDIPVIMATKSQVGDEENPEQTPADSEEETIRSDNEDQQPPSAKVIAWKKKLRKKAARRSRGSKDDEEEMEA